MDKGIFYDFDQMISKDTFKQYSGKDLDLELGIDDVDNAPDLFLCDTQQFLIDFIKQPKYENEDFEDLINKETALNEIDTSTLDNKEIEIAATQLKRINFFKRAVFHQAQFFLMNGQKYLFDGYNRTTNTIIDLSVAILSPRAEDDLRQGAFLNIRKSGSSVKRGIYGGR